MNEFFLKIDRMQFTITNTITITFLVFWLVIWTLVFGAWYLVLQSY